MTRMPLTKLLLGLLGSFALAWSCPKSQPDKLTYSISPKSRTVQAGETASYTVTVTKKANINAEVILRVANLQPGLTAGGASRMGSTQQNADINITAAGIAEPGRYKFQLFVTEVGTAEGSPDDLELVVDASGGQPDFLLSVDPAEIAFTSPGTSPTLTYTVTRQNGFTGTVALALGNLPDDLQISAPVTPATVTFAADDGFSSKGGSFLLELAPVPPVPAQATLTLTATSGLLSHTRSITVNMPQVAETGSIAVRWTIAGGEATVLSCPRGTSVRVKVDGVVKGSTGCFFPQPLTISGLSLGAHALAIELVDNEGTVLASASANATVTSGATSGAQLDLVPPDFELSIAPAGALSLDPGNSTTATVTVAPLHGFAEDVALTATNLPAGVTAVFDPTHVTASGTSTLTLTAAADAPFARETFSVEGQSRTQLHFLNPPISVAGAAAPDFSVGAAPIEMAVAAGGSSTNITVSTAALGGFLGTVLLGISGLPAGVTASFGRPSVIVGRSTTLALTASASAATTASPVTVVVSAQSGTLSRIVNLRLSIVPAGSGNDFSLSATPAAFSLLPGGRGSVIVTSTVQGTSSGTVFFSFLGLPAGVTAAVTKALSVGGRGTVTFTAAPGAAAAAPATVTLRGQAGSLIRDTQVQVGVLDGASPSFQLTATPSSLLLVPGATATTVAISVSPSNGFSGDVMLTRIGDTPTGAVAFMPTSSTSGSASLLLAAIAGAPPTAATFTLRIVGLAGGQIAETTVAFQVGTLPSAMVPVGSGTFSMGCPLSTGCPADALPLHPVTITGFLLDATEVTQGQYQECVAAGTCADLTQSGCNTYRPATTPNVPVTCVSGPSAADYCAFRGKRLPTEAEWEFAARTPDNRQYPWGNDPPGLDCTRLNYGNCESPGPLVAGLRPMGIAASCAQDLAGNAAEWVSDNYSDTWYQVSPSTDPIGPTGTLPDGGPLPESFRGGNFRDFANGVRSFARASADPHATLDSLGFRCARTSAIPAAGTGTLILNWTLNGTSAASQCSLYGQTNVHVRVGTLDVGDPPCADGAATFTVPAGCAIVTAATELVGSDGGFVGFSGSTSAPVRIEDGATTEAYLDLTSL